MPSFKSIAAGLVTLLAADAAIAGPCRPSSTTTAITAPPSSSASTDGESSAVLTGTTSSAFTGSSISVTAGSSSTVSISSTVVTSSATSGETEAASSSETASTGTTSATLSTTESTTAAETTSTTSAIESTSTTVEGPPTLPTIVNANFDDNSNGDPWIRNGAAGVSNGAVYWKVSEPNVMVLRPGTSIAQQINNLRPNQGYRVRFSWVKFDTPSATAGCKLSATFGGESLGEVALLPPRTPNNVFEEFVSTVYQPSSTSAELKIGMACLSPSSNRFVVENVSIEFVQK